MLEKLNSTIPTLSTFSVTKEILEKLGLGLDNPVKTVFLEFLAKQLVFKG
jgi:hypothetical protein